MEINKEMKEYMNNILKLLNQKISSIVLSHLNIIERDAFELRMRVGSPLSIKCISGSFFLDINKKTAKIADDYYLISKMDIEETISSLTLNSIHAFEKEIQQGYITIEGGHRVGLCGDCIYNHDDFKGFKSISSLNIRIAREFRGCSKEFMKYIINNSGSLYNTLIVGPPLSGKTTFLRDIAANLSDGLNEPYFPGCELTIIDERGEISAPYNGISQMYIGKRTDVLSYCMKRDGFLMSIRAMAPKAIISDELGTKDDFETVQYALKSGVNIISTAHGFDIEDIRKNIYLKDIVENNFFDRIVTLAIGKKPSTVSQIYDISKGSTIYDSKN